MNLSFILNKSINLIDFISKINYDVSCIQFCTTKTKYVLNITLNDIRNNDDIGIRTLFS